MSPPQHLLQRTPAGTLPYSLPAVDPSLPILLSPRGPVGWYFCLAGQGIVTTICLCLCEKEISQTSQIFGLLATERFRVGAVLGNG